MTLENQIKKNNYKRIDLTSYSKNELSFITYNTKDIYDMRFHAKLIDVLKIFYRFTENQLQVLIMDLENELNDYQLMEKKSLKFK
tara:strand:- start:1440 stop:1694 length:255 start_codon:yes stop_codon:yes gene_type:complete